MLMLAVPVGLGVRLRLPPLLLPLLLLLLPLLPLLPLPLLLDMPWLWCLSNRAETEGGTA